MEMPKTSPEIGGMGHSVKRKEDARFIRGKGNYVDDVRLPGMIWLDIVRSPYAHAKITKIDTAKALADTGSAGRDNGSGSRQIQSSLDADFDVRHPDGSAGGESDVSGSGSRGGSRHGPIHRGRWCAGGPGRITSRCRWSSTLSRPWSRGRRCFAPTKKIKKTTTSGTGKLAIRRQPTKFSRKPK